MNLLAEPSPYLRAKLASNWLNKSLGDTAAAHSGPDGIGHVVCDVLLHVPVDHSSQYVVWAAFSLHYFAPNRSLPRTHLYLSANNPWRSKLKLVRAFAIICIVLSWLHSVTHHIDVIQAITHSLSGHGYLPITLSRALKKNVLHGSFRYCNVSSALINHRFSFPVRRAITKIMHVELLDHACGSQLDGEVCHAWPMMID